MLPVIDQENLDAKVMLDGIDEHEIEFALQAGEDGQRVPFDDGYGFLQPHLFDVLAGDGDHFRIHVDAQQLSAVVLEAQAHQIKELGYERYLTMQISEES